MKVYRNMIKILLATNRIRRAFWQKQHFPLPERQDRIIKAIFRLPLFAIHNARDGTPAAVWLINRIPGVTKFTRQYNLGNGKVEICY